MNRRILFFCAAAVWYLTPLANQTSAAIIARDFRSAGDGLLTYDTLNQREWLDLNETFGKSVEEIEIELTDAGEYRKFHLATFEDVRSLAISVGFDPARIPGKQDFDVAHALFTKVAGDLGPSVWLAPGLVSDDLGDFDYLEVSLIAAPGPLIPGGQNHPVGGSDYSVGGLLSARSEFFDQEPINGNVGRFPLGGYWLYRNAAVPEPCTVAPATVALIAGLLGKWRHRKTGY